MNGIYRKDKSNIIHKGGKLLSQYNQLKKEEKEKKKKQCSTLTISIQHLFGNSNFCKKIKQNKTKKERKKVYSDEKNHKG